MTQVMVYGQPMVEADNPWAGTKYGKSGRYLRDAVPWDNREQGTSALSDSQKKATDAFTSASESSVGACSDKINGAGMGGPVCRVKYIEDQLEGNTY